jgi:hypothetical protein
VYHASSAHCTDTFATAAKAATNMVPVPHPLQHYIKMVHADYAFCHSGTKRCLEEMKIAPINPTFLAPIGHGVMSSHTAPSANHTRRWNHTNREFKPWTNWRYGFSTGRGWLMALWIFVEDTAKTDAAINSRVMMGD